MRIEVEVTGAAPAANVDEWTARVPELMRELTKKLDACGEALTLPCYAPGARNSASFQVVGAIYKTVRAYQREHGRPECVTIACDTDATARLYRQIYNFYMADTKAVRMQEPDWD